MSKIALKWRLVVEGQNAIELQHFFAERPLTGESVNVDGYSYEITKVVHNSVLLRGETIHTVYLYAKVV